MLLRLGAVDLERGAKVAGHRGYYLTGPGVRLNQALINYGMDWLEKRNFSLIQTPFFMQKQAMSKTAQLDDFDEALYHVSAPFELKEGYRRDGMQYRSQAMERRST